MGQRWGWLSSPLPFATLSLSGINLQMNSLHPGPCLWVCFWGNLNQEKGSFGSQTITMWPRAVPLAWIPEWPYKEWTWAQPAERRSAQADWQHEAEDPDQTHFSQVVVSPKTHEHEDKSLHATEILWHILFLLYSKNSLSQLSCPCFCPPSLPCRNKAVRERAQRLEIGKSGFWYQTEDIELCGLRYRQWGWTQNH